MRTLAGTRRAMATPSVGTPTPSIEAWRASNESWDEIDGGRSSLAGHPLFGAQYSDQDLDTLAGAWCAISGNYIMPNHNSDDCVGRKVR